MKKVFLCISLVLVAAYMLAAFIWTGKSFQKERCEGVRVIVEQRDTVQFVTPELIVNELVRMKIDPKGTLLSEIDTEGIEEAFKKKDYVEDAQCYLKSDNNVVIDIVPIQPVVRLFADSSSYYMNREGKLVATDERFFVDLPVLSGNFSDNFPATRLLPMIDYIEGNPVLRDLVSSIEVSDSNNIFIIPNIAGHVVNMGTADGYESKFAKLLRMYREVLPVKGWDMYDTIGVKWDHQIVAKKRRGGSRLNVAEYLPEEDESAPDMETVMTSSGNKVKDNI